MQALGYAVHGPKESFAPFRFENRELRPSDVLIEITHCGVCHSDIHQARDEWGNAIYPMVPGHEIIGKVRAVGGNVKKFAVGDTAGVGCMVDSCRECDNCKNGEEQFCRKGANFTYNSRNKDGSPTYGGYADHIVVDEAYTLRVSDKLDPAAAAPLLCAGITTYSPLRHWNVKAGQRVGVVGLGGLGHMGLKFAHAFGAHVTQFTTSLHKKDDALRLGADDVVLSTDAAAMEALAGSFDFILNTVSARHDLNQYLRLLKVNGTMTLLGVPGSEPSLDVGSLIFRRGSLAGSLIGGIAQTQEMLDFCAEHNIVSDVEVIAIQDIEKAFDRTVASDVKYRFVIDLASLAADREKLQTASAHAS